MSSSSDTCGRNAGAAIVAASEPCASAVTGVAGRCAPVDAATAGACTSSATAEVAGFITRLKKRKRASLAAAACCSGVKEGSLSSVGSLAATAVAASDDNQSTLC